jgi:trans-aconitate methyltransferase
LNSFRYIFLSLEVREFDKESGVYYIVFLFLLLPSFFLSSDEWCGSDYTQHSSVQQSHAERLLQSIQLKGDESILDIGCGNGRLSCLLASRVPRGCVIGIDPSSSMLAQAELAARCHPEFAHLRFYQADAETFTLEERFDHAIAIHVMHWISEQEKALRNIHAHLKCGGKIHFILAPSKEGLPFYRALQKTVIRWQNAFVDFINPQQVFDMETYRLLLVQAGFSIDQIHYIRHKTTHKNRQELLNWIRQWLPHGKHLPAEKQDLFFQELIDGYCLEMGLDPQGIGPIDWEEYVLIVEGRKRSTEMNSKFENLAKPAP